MRIFLVFLALISISFTEVKAEEDQKVLLAILARNKAHMLPRFFNCIDQLDYDKKLITVYINTNNNQDNTEEIINEWVQLNQHDYNQVVVESHNVKNVTDSRPHEWTPSRFKTLGKIRNKSLKKTKEFNCDYYFVVDCDNFIQPYTLKELIAKDKPIIAPLLHAIPEPRDAYSNYFCAVSPTGYYQAHPDYMKILNGSMRGTFKVPVVHCTYLIQAAYIDRLTYVDNSEDYEFVIFSRCARNNQIDQYICNEMNFGILWHAHGDLTLEEEAERFQLFELNE